MERGRQEQGGLFGPSRRKAGLETPLEGRFSKENRRLVFAPPLWYDLLVAGVLVGGLALIGLSVTGAIFGPDPIYGMFVGTMLVFAGIWGALSNERMSCNLTFKTYARLEGQGLSKRRVQGSLAEIDALVLLAEELALPLRGSRTVVYRLVLHWKGSVHPLLVVEREARAVPPGAPIHFAAMDMLRRGQAYAGALGVKFHDNSYFHSPCPVPVV